MSQESRPDVTGILPGCHRISARIRREGWPDGAGILKISRRGRKRLRHSLFMAMITILATNPEFRQLHQRNLKRETNPLNKMQSIVALCGKLIRVFYALLRTGNDYSAEKMLGDIKQSMKTAA